MSSVSAGWFFTTVPHGKPYIPLTSVNSSIHAPLKENEEQVINQNHIGHFREEAYTVPRLRVRWEMEICYFHNRPSFQSYDCLIRPSMSLEFKDLCMSCTMAPECKPGLFSGLQPKVQDLFWYWKKIWLGWSFWQTDSDVFKTKKNLSIRSSYAQC